MDETEIGIVIGIVIGMIAASVLGLFFGYAWALCIERKPQEPNKKPAPAATAQQPDCTDGHAVCPQNMPDDMLTAEFVRRGETDESIRHEFERRVALQMQPINERAAKLAKDAWREW